MNVWKDWYYGSSHILQIHWLIMLIKNKEEEESAWGKLETAESLHSLFNKLIVYRDIDCNTLKCVGRIKPRFLYCTVNIVLTKYILLCCTYCIAHLYLKKKKLSQILSLSTLFDTALLSAERVSGNLPPCGPEEHLVQVLVPVPLKVPGPEAVHSCSPGTILSNITSKQCICTTVNYKEQNTDCHVCQISSAISPHAQIIN